MGNLSKGTDIYLFNNSYTRSIAATCVSDNYALFAGGYNTQSGYDNQGIKTLDKSLTIGSVFAGLGANSARSEIAASHVGNYALFGGGFSKANNAPSNIVTAIDKSLTRIIPDPLLVAVRDAKATHVGNYVIFGGGADGSYPTNSVCAYDSSLTRISSINSLTVPMRYHAATHVGNYALFGGGQTYANNSFSYTNNVDGYDSSLTKVSTVSNLDYNIYMLAATHVGDYAIFSSGIYYSYSSYGGSYNAYSNITAYNTSLTKSQGGTIGNGGEGSGSASINNTYAFIVGGRKDNSLYSSVNIIDTSLTRSNGTALTNTLCNMASTGFRNFAIFAGGQYDKYEHYTSLANVYIYKNFELKKMSYIFIPIFDT